MTPFIATVLIWGFFLSVLGLAAGGFISIAGRNNDVRMAGWAIFQLSSFVLAVCAFGLFIFLATLMTAWVWS